MTRRVPWPVRALAATLAALAMVAGPGFAHARARSDLARIFRAPQAERRAQHTPTAHFLRQRVARDARLRLEATGDHPSGGSMATQGALHMATRLERLRFVMVEAVAPEIEPVATPPAPRAP